jgi:DNA-binding NarL/FixJ family response regulator
MNAPLNHTALVSPIAMASAYPVDGSAAFSSPVSGEVRLKAISIISSNAIFRTCLARCLGTMIADFTAVAYASLAEWKAGYDATNPGVVLLCSTDDRSGEANVKDDLGAILGVDPAAKVLVLSDVERPALVRSALGAGSRGLASMNIELDILASAIRLVAIGGTYVPASSLLAASSSEAEIEAAPNTGPFSRRQLDVLDRVRQGDPNKIIAFKLNMSEATVKIHVRNMMRKIKARNRTELIFKSHALAVAA